MAPPKTLKLDMAAEGENIVEHVSRKYGMPPEQVRAHQAAIRERGKAVGFEFNAAGRSRSWNTFDAQRLLRWAGTQGRAIEPKHALLTALMRGGQAAPVTRVKLPAAAQAKARTGLQRLDGS